MRIVRVKPDTCTVVELTTKELHVGAKPITVENPLFVGPGEAGAKK